MYRFLSTYRQDERQRDSHQAMSVYFIWILLFPPPAMKKLVAGFCVANGGRVDYRAGDDGEHCSVIF